MAFKKIKTSKIEIMEDGNKPAFSNCVGMSDAECKDLGLTKREYFAAMILQGMCAGRTEHESPEPDVGSAVKMADYLLHNLKSQPNE